jgi:exodeoxyribonuclease V gamma subunit
MLTVIRSNRVERLLAELARQLVTRPPASVFTPATVVAPSPAMARWVNLRLAGICGVAANLDYPLPAGFVWRLARGLLDDLPDADPLSLDAVTWQVFAELPALLAASELAPLRRYLRDDTDGRKRWQLAARIADVYDRCQLYRPALVRAWTDGADDTGRGGDTGAGEPWQAPLWRRLVAGRETLHRVAVLDRLLAALLASPPRGVLPERVALFAVSSLPPALVQVFQALARHIPVDLYLHTPTDQFWSDLVSQKAMARKRLAAADDADLWEVGNPLLGSWGRQGQALHDLLLDAGDDPAEVDAYATDWPDTLLGRLQRDLFALEAVPAPGAREPMPVDDSVQVHLCHGPARECQVLHDALLAMFQAEPDLRPEDVLVMVPEIGRYAPDIEAVFDRHRPDGSAPDADAARPPFIPWNLSDIAVADEHPLVRVFLRLLALPESRFTRSEVLSYLDVPELAAHFGLDADAVAQVKEWLASANLRWGLDGAHKARLGLPETVQNTWAQAGERLFAGYAMGEGAFADIAPVPGVEGKAAAALGGFWLLFDRLRTAAARLAEPRPAADWQRDLGRLLADFFGERDDADGRLQRIRDAIAELAEQAGGVAEPLSPALVRAWLEARLGDAGGERRGGRYFSGGVTFCGMRPMRSLPFEVICVLGLDDEAFPRRDRPVEFDPMGRAWRPGDPRKSDEDRYLFLETLLGARRRLYLSCVGRDSRKNDERQPSVLLRELMDHLDQYFTTDTGGSISQAITRVHALQPFSPARFTPAGGSASAEAPDPRSFDAHWCRIARAVRQAADRPASPDIAWPDAALPPVPDAMRDVTLTQLERFLAHPLRWFVQTRLGVYLWEEEPEPDDEPFDLDRLAAWALKTRLVEDRLAARPASAARLAAEGLLPHGAFGHLALESEQAALAPLDTALAPYAGERPSSLQLDLTFTLSSDGPCGLSGQVGGLYPGLGLLRWRAGRLRGEHRLKLWLAHLARWAVVDAARIEEPEPSVLLGLDDPLVLARPLSQADARAELEALTALYWEGLHRPLPIFPRASAAFAEVWRKEGADAEEKALNAARRAWLGNSFNNIPGDAGDAYIQLVLRGVTADPLANPEFPELALKLYGPLLDAEEAGA